MWLLCTCVVHTSKKSKMKTPAKTTDVLMTLLNGGPRTTRYHLQRRGYIVSFNSCRLCNVAPAAIARPTDDVDTASDEFRFLHPADPSHKTAEGGPRSHSCMPTTCINAGMLPAPLAPHFCLVVPHKSKVLDPATYIRT